MAVFGVSASLINETGRFDFKKWLREAFVVLFGASLVIAVSYLPNMADVHIAWWLITSAIIGWGGPKMINKFIKKQTGIDVEK